MCGTDAAPLELPDGTKVGVLVCYEDTVPAAVREEVVLGAELLVGLADLRAFRDPTSLNQHF